MRCRVQVPYFRGPLDGDGSAGTRRLYANWVATEDDHRITLSLGRKPLRLPIDLGLLADNELFRVTVVRRLGTAASVRELDKFRQRRVGWHRAASVFEPFEMSRRYIGPGGWRGVVAVAAVMARAEQPIKSFSALPAVDHSTMSGQTSSPAGPWQCSVSEYLSREPEE